MMRLILEVISGPKTGQKIIARAGQVVRIGRTSKAGVAMDDTFMSSQHFAIECVGGACGLRDLSSRNGTKLNGEKISRAVLHHGDRVHAGETEFVVHIDLDDTSSAPVPHGALKTTLPPTEPMIFIPNEKAVVKPQPPTPSGKKSGRAPRTRDIKDSLGVIFERGTPPPSERRTPPISERQTPPISERQTPPISERQTPPLREVAADKNAVTHDSLGDRAPQVLAGMDQAIRTYEAATPAGTLLGILQNQPEPLMALVDATRDKRVLDLLRNSGEEYRSLYRDNENLALAPYLVRLPPQSPFLKQIVREGWGHGWGVYLTCSTTLNDLREYFRRALMVSMPDGVEMFSRFYDPRFFRGFLESCTGTEAQRFFGPIRSYLMEADRPEILLEFTKGSDGAEKKGHLLTMLE